MRVAIVYDCLFPYTIGGAERWYRSLAQRLAPRHHVTYLTRRQWDGAPPSLAKNVEIVTLGGGAGLYNQAGRRKISPPLRFGLEVLGHLLGNRRQYDLIHTCGFPYFPLLAASMVSVAGGPPVVADWFEVWPRSYWDEYLGPAGGAVGAAVQRMCARATRHAFVFSQLYAARLRAEGYAGQPIVLTGMHEEEHGGRAEAPRRREPLVVFAGRHIAEKRAAAIPQAIAIARAAIPELRAVIFGDGPERRRVLGEIERLGLGDVVRCPGFVEWSEVDAALSRALCLLMPSVREGYGLIVVEAAARGTPAIVTRAPDNAATELVDDAVNGFVVDNAQPATLADAIVRAYRANGALSQSTRQWFAAKRRELSIEASIERIEQVYEQVRRRR